MTTPVREPHLPGSYLAFTGFTVLACIVLCVQVLRLSRENQRLRDQSSQAATRAGSSAVTVGEYVPSLVAIGADGKPALSEEANYLNFRDGRVATVMLATSGGCHTCEESLPAFDVLAGKHAGDGITVVAVQIDAMAVSELSPPPTLRSLPLVMVQDAPQTWLRRIPLVPSVIVIDGGGAIRHTWFGALSTSQQEELDGLLAGAPQGWTPGK
ncbi:MAG: hypothetical protein H7210_10055 [Pyrinomonadaceae bacterium]|nr:hypothetical protein [Phycisphaerales bacterium]